MLYKAPEMGLNLKEGKKSMIYFTLEQCRRKTPSERKAEMQAEIVLEFYQRFLALCTPQSYGSFDNLRNKFEGYCAHKGLDASKYLSKSIYDEYYHILGDNGHTEDDCAKAIKEYFSWLYEVDFTNE